MGLGYVMATDRLVGRGGSYTDTLNRALRDLLSGSGYDPDATTFPGVMGPAFNVVAHGADKTGATDSRTAFNTAQTNAGASQRITVPSGTYKISSNLTITSPVVFEPGAALSVDVGVTVTINGAVLAAPSYQVFGGLGSVVISPLKTPRVYALWFPGADIGAKVNAAVAGLTASGQKGPGTIVVHTQGNSFSTQINLTNTKSLRITSVEGNPNSTTNWGPALVWTGTGTTAPVDATGAIGLEWDHIHLTYNSALFTGSVFKLNSATEPHIHHARVAGTTGVNTAAQLIELNGTLGFKIDNATLDHAVVGIGATGGSNNSVTIGAGVWFDRDFSDCQIKGWGGAWSLENTIAESGNNTAGAALVPFFKLAGDINGLTFDNCMCIDGGSGGGTLIDLQNFNASGVAVQGGNYTSMAGGTSTFLRASDVAGATSGLVVNGAYVSGPATGVHLGRSHGASVRAVLNCATPWTGSEPTNYNVGTSSFGTNTTSGVAVANNASIAITPNANTGRGLVFISADDNTSAIYVLDGAGSGTHEVSDWSNSYSPTVGTVGAFNIYWDAGTAKYRLENKRGATRLVAVTSLIPQ